MAYIGRQNLGGAYRQLDDISSGFDGSDTTHTMQVNSQNVTVGDVNQIILSLGGVIQKPGTDFTVSGSTLTFTTAPATNTSFFAILLGSDNGGTVTPSDASVTVSKLAIAGGEVKLDADGDTSITADTDDQIDFKLGGTDFMSLTTTGATITTADNEDTLTLISTDADASGGPVLDFYRNSSSPADSDTLGKIVFRGRNDNSQDVDYANIDVTVSDVSDGAESNAVFFRTMLSGTLTEMIKLQHIGSAGSVTGEVAINDGSGDINFRAESNGNTDMIKVDAGNDRVGVGTGSPATTFHVEAAEHNNTSFELRHTGDGSSNYPYGQAIRFQNSNRDNNTEYFLLCIDSSGAKLRVDSDGDVKNHDNSYGSISDERIKQDIRDSNSQWNDIKAVKVRNFKKKDDVKQYGDKAWEQIGVIAQELEDAGMDKLVKDEVLDEDGNIIEYKSVKYSILYMKAIKALQEAMAKIETLEADVKTLKGE